MPIRTIRVLLPDRTSGNSALLNTANVFTNLNTFTGLRIATRAVGDDFNFGVTDFNIEVDASMGGINGQLPFALGTGQMYHCKKIDPSTNVVTVNAQAGDLIDGSISVALIDQWSDCWLIDAAFQYWDQVGGL